MGRYVRFRRTKLWGRYNTKYFRRLADERATQTFPDQPLPAVLQNRGVKVEDPNHPDFPRKTSLDPIELNHPAWPKPNSIESHPWFRKVPGFLYTGEDQLAEGANHAAAITKSVLRRGLPDSILQAADWLKLSATTQTVQQLILHSQRWDATTVQLPKRRDPIIWWQKWPTYFGIPQERKNELLLDNLYRFSQTEGVRNAISDLKSRRYVRSAPINVVYDRLGQTICVNVTPQITVSQPEFIAPTADSQAIEQTAKEPMFDIRPVTTTSDLKKADVFNPGTVTPFSWSVAKQVIHTVFINKTNDVFYPWAPHELTGHAVMAAFAAALASARLVFPEATGRLPEPITTQCVQCCGGTFEFVVFQLNTVDFKDDSGIKNVVYVDAANRLFSTHEHWKPYQAVADYNPEVLRKYVALLSNGVNVKK